MLSAQEPEPGSKDWDKMQLKLQWEQSYSYDGESPCQENYIQTLRGPVPPKSDIKKMLKYSAALALLEPSGQARNVLADNLKDTEKKDFVGDYLICLFRFEDSGYAQPFIMKYLDADNIRPSEKLHFLEMLPDGRYAFHIPKDLLVTGLFQSPQTSRDRFIVLDILSSIRDGKKEFILGKGTKVDADEVLSEAQDRINSLLVELHQRKWIAAEGIFLSGNAEAPPEAGVNEKKPASPPSVQGENGDTK